VSGHFIDSAVHGHLWTTPEVRAMFTDEGRLRAWLEILAQLAEAQAEVGLIPREAADAIRAGIERWEPDPQYVGELTRECGHSTLGLIHALREQLPPEAREWVYYGATVQDITDTWFAITMRDIGVIVERDLRRAHSAAVALASAYRDTPMCGRTHGQPGLPITFGFKVAVWASELDRHIDRVQEGRHRREVAQLGGGVGSMEFWEGRAPALLDSYARRLGLTRPAIPWLTARDAIAEFVALLAMITATIAKIGEEILQLQRPEIGELHEPASEHGVGSITMPHKRNPEVSEHVGTLARLVRANAGLAMESMVHSHERDGRAWKAEWILLPESCHYSGAALQGGIWLLEGLEVDVKRMRRNLDSHQGYLASGAVMRALSQEVGKHVAHEIVFDVSRRGIGGGITFRQALRLDARLDAITDDHLDVLLDPLQSLGSIPEFVDAVTAVRHA
jgi:adenylosuccinate lyase